MKRMNFVIAYLRPSQNVKLGVFTGSRAVDGTEMYKKVWRMHVQSFFRLVKLLLFWLSRRRRILNFLLFTIYCDESKTE